MMLLLLYILLPLLAIYHLLTKNYGYWESLGVPTDKPFLFFGSFFKVATRQEHLFHTIRRIYTNFKSHPYVGIYIFGKPTLLVSSPELLKKILVKDFDKFVNRPSASNEKIDPIAFHTLFSAKDNHWKGVRSKISPVFTSGKMKAMLPLMNDVSKDLKQFLDECSGQVIDAKMLMKRFSVDVIASCAFGINSNCIKKQKDNEVWNMATQLLNFNNFIRSFSVFSFFFVPKFVDWFKLTFVDQDAADYFMNVFTSVYKERKELNILRHDLIDLLHKLKEEETITDDYKFDDVKMASQAISFFSAGQDATSLTVTFALYELAINKSIQNNLKIEVQDNVKKYGGLTYEGILEMKYLDMVIEETLRKYPLTVFLSRLASEAYEFKETGLKIEKNTSVFVPVAGLHYDPEYFPNPEKFDPDRFTKENKTKIPSYTYLPFGDGPRNCIGQRFALLLCKVALASIVSDFTIEKSESTSIPIKFQTNALFLQNNGPMNLKFIKD